MLVVLMLTLWSHEVSLVPWSIKAQGKVSIVECHNEHEVVW